MEKRIERGVFLADADDPTSVFIRWMSASGYKREFAGSIGRARTLLTLRRKEALDGTKLPRNLRSKVSFEQVARDAIAWSAGNKKSATTDKFRIEVLIKEFGPMSATSMEHTDLEQGLDRLSIEFEWSPSTYNRHRTTLQMIFREAIRLKKVRHNPAREIQHKREPEGRIRYLSREPGENGEKSEYDRLIDTATKLYPEHLAEVLFALNTGLRLGSQYSARYENLDVKKCELYLPDTKPGTSLRIPLNQTAMDAIRSLPSWKEQKGPIFRDVRHPDKPLRSNDHWFRPAVKAAGILNFHWHDLRHTFASWLVQDGVSLHTVAILLGHSTKSGLRMTMRYAHLAPNQLQDAVRLLPAATLPPVPAKPRPKVVKFRQSA